VKFKYFFYLLSISAYFIFYQERVLLPYLIKTFSK